MDFLDDININLCKERNQKCEETTVNFRSRKIQNFIMGSISLLSVSADKQKKYLICAKELDVFEVQAEKWID